MLGVDFWPLNLKYTVIVIAAAAFYVPGSKQNFENFSSWYYSKYFCILIQNVRKLCKKGVKTNWGLCPTQFLPRKSMQLGLL